MPNDAITLLEEALGTPEPLASPTPAAPVQAGLPDSVSSPGSQPVGLANLLSILGSLGKSGLQGQSDLLSKSVGQIVPNWDQYKNTVGSITARTAGPALGAALGTGIAPGIGTAVGTGLGILGGNLLDPSVKNPNILTNPETQTNIAWDTAFQGLPTAINVGRSVLPKVVHSDFTKSITKAFERQGIPFHPLQIDKDFANLYRKGTIDRKGIVGLQNLKSGQDAAIQAASDNALVKLGTAPTTPEELSALASKVGQNITNTSKAIGSQFDEVGKLMGKKKIDGTVLVTDLKNLKATLIKKGDAQSAKLVDNAIEKYVQPILNNVKTKSLNWEQIKGLRTALKENLQNDFVNPFTGQLSTAFQSVKKTLNASFDKLEETLAGAAAVSVKDGKIVTSANPIQAPFKLDQARKAYAGFKQGVKDLGKGTELQKFFNNAGRNPEAAQEALTNNPTLLLDQFLKSKNPQGFLKTVEKYAGPEAKELIGKQFGQKILADSSNVVADAKNINQAAGAVGKKYATHSQALYGKSATKTFIKDAQDLAAVKSVTKQSPTEFSSTVNKTLNPDASIDSVSDVIKNTGRSTIGGQVGRGAGLQAGAVLGGAVGASQGNNPQDRFTNAALGAVTGAGGSLLINPLLRAGQNFFQPNLLKPNQVTNASQLAQYSRPQDIFDLLRYFKEGGIGSSLGLGAEAGVRSAFSPQQ